MKRTRRHKLIHISVIFLAYSCYSMVQVLSENSADTEKVVTAHPPTQASITEKPTDYTILKSTILPNIPEKTTQKSESKEATKLPLLNKDKEEIEDTNAKHHEKKHDETEGKKHLTENNNEESSSKSTITSESKETSKIEQEGKTKEENKENNKQENKENNKEVIKENNKEETKENKAANKVNSKEEKKDANKEEKNKNNKEVKKESKKEENKEQKKEENKDKNKNDGAILSDKTELTKNNEKKIEEKPKNESEKEIRLTTISPRPTMRAPRENCTPPAIEQFPEPLMGPEARKHGGLIIHVIVAIYTFMGLAIVCDEYFVSSLDRICEELKLSPDVAGATFMAAGSSAPELATVVIGVFFAKDDIGVSGVIGSAVFNIMFVISICALCAGTVCHLNWWPLVRDCFFYAVAILVMLFTIYDKIITWDESIFMLFMYVVYCVALHYNAILQRWAETHLPLPASCIRPLEEETALVSYRTLHEDRSRVPSYSGTPPNMTPGQENLGESYINMEQGFTSPTSGGPQLNQMQGNPPPVPPPPQVQAPTQEYYKPKSDEAKPSPLIKPTEGGYYELISWAVVYPIHYMCTATMPDCKSEKYKNWYPFTFLVSMIWISFYSYIMVWMITIIGSTLGIPDTVMGLTFVAAGVSVPDALSSIAVIKEGYGDMAVSNAVGSNVFDILICLGLPWFIQTAIILPGSHVNVISKGLTYSTLSLLSTVVFLVVATHLNGWKLDKRYGIILMVWYVIFIIFASMYELNLFGQLNPEECPSDY